MDAMVQDFKYAIRSLTRSAGTTVVIVATLGLAIGTSALMFTVAANVLQSVPVRLLLLMAALLVWIACAKVANVVLARAMNRRRELAVRSAIGASRLGLVRLILVEDVMLSIASGAAGLLPAILAAMFPGPDRHPLAYGLVLVLVGTVALAASYVPARAALRAD